MCANIEISWLALNTPMNNSESIGNFQFVIYVLTKIHTRRRRKKDEEVLVGDSRTNEKSFNSDTLRQLWLVLFYQEERRRRQQRRRRDKWNWRADDVRRSKWKQPERFDRMIAPTATETNIKKCVSFDCGAIATFSLLREMRKKPISIEFER